MSIQFSVGLSAESGRNAVSGQAINYFKADLREISFVLFEHLKISELLGKAPYEEWGEDEAKMVIDEVYRFATNVTGPYNGIGDRQGCRLENGRVYVPEGFKQAWDKIYEAGWRMLSAPEKLDGQGAPFSLGAAAEELISGSNTAFAMYPGLALGAAEVIAEFGTERQLNLYAKRMCNGEWGGTMCLTEAQAGSDVGAATTMAYKQEDGRYKIKGSKIFISGGDHDMGSNIVHLVLARVEGAMPGTKGLSLFIVPRVRVDESGNNLDDNDVAVAGIEHKMGINGSATCQMQFGENDDCYGELVGAVEHQGMRQMFQMMNFARIGVGIQGLSIASTAYLNALEYAKERKQGSSIKNFKDAAAPRVAIIEHPNVRKDLLGMKARVEGIRALIYKLAMHQDRAEALDGKDDDGAAYHRSQVELLTPIVKSYASDQAFQICERAVQIYGGHGYLQDHPVEQYCRDSKIFSIYEGTNAIQAMDLVARKLGQNGGKNTQVFMGEVGKFVKEFKDHEVLGAAVKNLGKAHETVAGGAMQFLMWSQQKKIEVVVSQAERFQDMMSELVVGWLLLEQAAIALEKLPNVAEDHRDHAFYKGKVASAVHFALNYLPLIVAKGKVLTAGDTSPLDIPDGGFASI